MRADRCRCKLRCRCLQARKTTNGARRQVLAYIKREETDSVLESKGCTQIANLAVFSFNNGLNDGVFNARAREKRTITPSRCAPSRLFSKQNEPQTQLSQLHRRLMGKTIPIVKAKVARSGCITYLCQTASICEGFRLAFFRNHSAPCRHRSP